MAHEMDINRTLKKVILLGQALGYFPVIDLNRNPHFSVKSFRFGYAVFTMIGPCFMFAMQLVKAVTGSFTLFQVEKLSAYAGSAYACFVFIELATKWSRLMEEWRFVENNMKNYGFPKKLNRNIYLIVVFFVTMLLVEYILHQTSRIYRAKGCHEDHNRAIKFFLSNLTLSHVFHHIPYNIPTSFLIHYWLFQIHFAFTYVDIFVMIMSMCLASRLKQVSHKIQECASQKVIDPLVWHQLRKDYTHLVNLCHTTNEKISNAILVSFLPNIFTILTQVYNSLKPRQNYVEAIYFYFSLVFLISRTAMVVICGAMVNEESRTPLNILNSVPPRIYNREIEIMIKQISNFETSMNGKNFFNIKRHIILEIASAIVTYELVLIQFNNEYLNSWSKSNRCE
ncbi:hypothetical protein GWI33_014361 [Rhynchophorus ferrugineus]|uniref:Gustatory receptor n=1 Tax=Rhynchophorus ferrugineus TaxID=354439 RepID=A0A834I690_RHYFE|nr:hypothetical protein GWI33_014361 [Rhynchophorus ferrugineus]